MCTEVHAGKTVVREYRPALSAFTEYRAREGDFDPITQTESPEQGARCDAADTLPRSSVKDRAKAALGEKKPSASSAESWNLRLGLGLNMGAAPWKRSSRESAAEQAQSSWQGIGCDAAGTLPSLPEQQLAIQTVVDPTVKFYTGDDMLPVFTRVFTAIRNGFIAFVCQMDHTELCVLLVLALCRGASGRIMFDRGNFVSSSCARQAARVLELMDAGCQVKVMRPSGGGWACMHTKTWVIDSEVALTGSVNMTHNGLEKNKEHLFEIGDSGVVKGITTDFDEEWQRAEDVTPAVKKQMIVDMQNRESKSRRSRSASAGRVTQRDVTRSLSAELEVVSESPRRESSDRAD
jgi:hypothetical protein